MNFLFTGFWPWWLGALVLAGLTVGMWLIEHRFLGVSGSVGRVVSAEDVASRRAAQLLSEDEGALDDAMRAAAVKEFGEEALAALEAQASSQAAPAQPLTGPPAPRSAHIALLAMIPVGGVLAAWLSGSLAVRSDLGAQHSALVAHGALGMAVLLVGGLLVGLGTRTAGGCTTGHGMAGCARMAPPSFVATAAFFGTAVGVSFLLEAIAS